MDTDTTLETLEYIRIIFEHMPVGIALYAANNMRLLAANELYQIFFGKFLNPSRQFDHLIGHSLEELLPAQVASSFISRFFNVAKTGETFRREEYPYVTDSEGISYWNWTLEPVRDHNGEIVQLLATATEVTKQVLARQQAEQNHILLNETYQTIKDFLLIANHELRTPVTAIQGFAEILQMEAANDINLKLPRRQNAINSIIEQCQSLTRLFEEMLNISHLENKQFHLHIASHDLLKTINSVIETQTITARHYRIRLLLEGITTTDTLMGYFDEERIVQVLNNLIGNAIKYSPPGSDIEVGLRYADGQPDIALIWVKDNGIGIPVSELPQIFDRFYRASNLDRSISGLGLGLYLVNELVTRHGGKVWAESTEKAGSTFFVTFPLHTKQE
jgi:signal transduction histidine kinase